RKTIHEMATKVHSERILCKLYLAQNSQQVGQSFTDKFFRAQWQRQRDFETKLIGRKRKNRASFFERGEALKNLAHFSPRLNLIVQAPKPIPDRPQGFVCCQDSQPLSSIKPITRTPDFAGNTRPAKRLQRGLQEAGLIFHGQGRHRMQQWALGEKEKRLALLWSAKTALYKCVVQIQGETQPLRATKTRTKQLGTVVKEKIFGVLNRRKKAVSPTDYLTNHTPDQLDRPENQPIAHDVFKRIQLDDVFWNDGYMCLSKDPWALDPTVRTGIHTLLLLD
ncbi:hypothetical protein MJO29_014031, partial [Puccinia striiformis f. sp. tritici]